MCCFIHKGLLDTRKGTNPIPKFRNGKELRHLVFHFPARGGRGTGALTFGAAGWPGAPRMVLFRSRSFTPREKGNKAIAETDAW
jgi:hypothetical protein